MCMEDIRIGRKTTSKMYGITLVATDDVVVPYNPSRIALHIWAFSANGIPFSTEPNPSVVGGAYVSVASGGLHFDIQRDGFLVTQEWRCGGPPGQMLGWAETLLAEK